MEHLIGFLSNYSSHIIYLLSFLFLLMCGLGVPLPEDIILLTSGYFVHTGDIKMAPILILTYLGVVIGDSMLYFIGRFWGLDILKFRFFRKIFSEKKIDYAKQHFNLYGGKTIFLARYIVGVRSVTFWAAGVVRFSYTKFITMDGFAALISVPLLVYIGYIFGENVETISHKVKHFEVILSIVATLILFAIILYGVKKRKKISK